MFKTIFFLSVFANLLYSQINDSLTLEMDFIDLVIELREGGPE